MTVMPPIFQIGRLRIENITESGVTGVAGTGEHGEFATDLLWEHHSVAVVREESVLKLVELLEISRPRHPDRRAMIAIAPGDIVFAVNKGHSGVITINPFSDLGISAGELDILLVDVPFDTINGEADMEPHPAIRVIAAENSRIVVITFLERDDSRVEN